MCLVTTEEKILACCKLRRRKDIHSQDTCSNCEQHQQKKSCTEASILDAQQIPIQSMNSSFFAEAGRSRDMISLIDEGDIF